MLLANRRALVTGGAGRLGRAIATTLQREGSAVAIADRDSDRIDEVVAALARDGAPEITGVVGDVEIPGDITRMVAAAHDALSGIDVLVNCAGVFPNRPLLDMTVEEWDSVFAINTRGTMLACQAAAGRWVKEGVRGSIVNVSSGAATSARRGGSHYNSSKAAVNMLTHVLAIELGEHGIRVNAVAPGLILDEVITKESGDQHAYINMMLKGTPMGRTGDPMDVAEAVVFLASDRSAWTTGAILEVSGGSHCGRPHVPTTGDLR